jgi:hypothetical protein
VAQLTPPSPRLAHSTQLYADYKFALAFENSNQLGHITEKLMNVKLSGAVPIFWGDPEIGRHLNNNSFIHCAIPEITAGGLPSWF